jgi:sugar porter (SP) family MFS transporter
MTTSSGRNSVDSINSDSQPKVTHANYRKLHANSPKPSVHFEEFEIEEPSFEINVPTPDPRSIMLFGHSLTGKPLMYFTSCFVSLGVYIFGYDQGVMSGILTGPYFKAYFDNPTPGEVGTMVAILEIGALISSLLVGHIGDAIGRRLTIFYGSAVFVVGGAIQTFSTSVLIMIVGRVVAGLGVGMLSTIVPVYQSEVAPPANRGLHACIVFTGNIVGYASSVWVDYFCSFIDSDLSWRLPLFLQCVMGGLLMFGSLVIAETPRWLLAKDRDEEGMRALANLHSNGDTSDSKARQEFREIKQAVFMERLEGEKTFVEMWRRYYKRLFIAMSSLTFAQLNGINVISYYAPLVFEEAGWKGRDALLMTGINGLVYVASTIPPWILVDRWGRRPILLSGSVVMGLSLAVIAMFMKANRADTPTYVVIFVIIFNAFHGYSWGPIPWLYPPEILPLSIRAKGASLSTATNWAFNWLVGEVTPVLQQSIRWRLYLIHATSCAVSFFVVYFFYPETKGLHLEDMDSLFGDKSASSTPYSHTTDPESQDTESLLPKPSSIPSHSNSPRFLSDSPAPRSISPAGRFSLSNQYDNSTAAMRRSSGNYDPGSPRNIANYLHDH